MADGVQGRREEATPPHYPELDRQENLEALPLAALRTDGSGRVTAFNEAAAALWARRPETSAARSCDCFPLCGADGNAAGPDEDPVSVCLATGVPVEAMEAVARRPDGSRVRLLAWVKPLGDPTGRPAGTLALFADVTAAKAVEEALGRRRAELADFIERTTIGLHRVGPDGTILWANRAEMDMLGYEPHEYIGRHIAEFHADQDRISDILARLADDETLRNYEARLLCKDGSIRHVLIDSSVYREDGAFVHTRCYTRDVTDEKRKEQRIAVAASISQILSQAHTIDEAAPQVLGVLAEHFDGDVAELWVGDDRLARVAFHSRLDGPALDAFRKAAEESLFDPGEAFPGFVWDAARPVWFERLEDAPRFRRHQAAACLGLVGGLGIPILAGERCLGAVICFMRRPLVREPSLDRMVASTGYELGQFIERSRGEQTARHLAAIVEASRDAIWSWTPDGTITSWNAEAERLLQYSAEEIVGRSLMTLVPPERHDRARRVIERLRQGGWYGQYETVRLRRDGAPIDVEVTVSPIRDASGATVGAATTCRDIGDRKRTAALLEARTRALAAATERFRSLFTHAPVAMLMVDEDGRLEQANRAALATFGYDAADLIGREVDTLLPEPARAGHRRLRQGYLGAPTARPMGEGRELFGLRRNGETFPVEIGLNPVAADGGGTFVIASIVDISARRQAEERMRFVMRELTHRSKNLLALIQGMARQATASATDLESFKADFTERLQALSRSHELLIAREWQGASLVDLVRSQLAFVEERGSSAVTAVGPDILLAPAATQNLGLALHELATNAVKHGALSVAGAKIEITWQVTTCDGEDVLQFAWTEAGVPMTGLPARRGFGRTVLEAVVPRSLGGAARLEAAEGGVTWTFTGPMKHVVSGVPR